MKKTISLIVVLALCMSVCACAANSSQYTGTWNSIILRMSVTFDIKGDGTLIYESPKGAVKGEWKTVENGIEITILYHGTEYVASGRWALIPTETQGGFTYYLYGNKNFPDNADELIASGESRKVLCISGFPYQEDDGQISKLMAFFVSDNQ